MRGKSRILFICTHNSARSQMAEGLVNAYFSDRYEAFSAGTEPSEVNPLAIQALEEMGVDISRHRSKGVEEFLGQEFDYVVTVCDQANETCPYFPGGNERIHKGFKDPAGVTGPDERKLAAFRQIRDEIRAWLEQTFQA
jgi:arsenate reductase